AHLANELAVAEVTEHQLPAVVLFGDDADRAADDEIQGAGGIAGAEHLRARRVAPAVAVGEKAFDGRGGGRHRMGRAAIAADQGHRALLHAGGNGGCGEIRPSVAAEQTALPPWSPALTHNSALRPSA